MAKLVDALPSGGSVRKDVQVRILFWALAPFLRGLLFWPGCKITKGFLMLYSHWALFKALFAHF